MSIPDKWVFHFECIYNITASSGVKIKIKFCEFMRVFIDLTFSTNFSKVNNGYWRKLIYFLSSSSGCNGCHFVIFVFGWLIASRQCVPNWRRRNKKITSKYKTSFSIPIYPQWSYRWARSITNQLYRCRRIYRNHLHKSTKRNGVRFVVIGNCNRRKCNTCNLHAIQYFVYLPD